MRRKSGYLVTYRPIHLIGLDHPCCLLQRRLGLLDKMTRVYSELAWCCQWLVFNVRSNVNHWFAVCVVNNGPWSVGCSLQGSVGPFSHHIRFGNYHSNFSHFQPADGQRNSLHLTKNSLFEVYHLFKIHISGCMLNPCMVNQGQISAWLLFAPSWC